jgi:hypothetical protein
MNNRTILFDAIMILSLTFLGHYALNTQHQLQMSQQRNSINEDQIQDMVVQLINQNRDDNLELAKNQGHIEGLMTIQEPKEKKAYMDIWHAGYYNGVEQKKQEESMERLVAE